MGFVDTAHTGAKFTLTPSALSGEVSGSTARYLMKNSMHAVVGDLRVRLSVLDASGACLTTKELIFEVIEGNGTGDVTADTNYPILTELIVDMRKAISDSEAALEELKGEISDLESYADGKADAALAEAKSYADTKVAAAEQSVTEDMNAKDEMVLEEAKSYADGKDTENLSAAKNYADAKDGENLTAAKEYAEQKALNAQNSAIETAQSADSEMLLQAKNYADTKDGENLSAAKTYADTKDSETLESAKTYTDTKAAAAEDNAKTFGKQTFAGALQGEKFGGIVRVDDVSALDRRLDTVVSSKNIIPFPYANGTITKNGVIFTVSDDGSITMNGTATSSQGSWFWVGFNIPVKPGCTYTIKNLGENAKYDGTYWNNSTYWLGLNVRDVNSTIITSCTCANSDVSFTVGKEWKTIDISVVLKEGYTADNIVIKPQIEEGTVSTAYAKHVSDLSGVSLKKYGKNLIPYPYISGNSVTTNGITYTVDSSTKAITANGTASATAYFSVLDKAHAILLPPGTYFLSGNEKGVKNAELYLKYTDENSNDKYAVDRGSGVSFTVKNATPASVGISVGAGVTVSNAVFKPQLELGSAKTAFESPGTPETYTVGADGSVANLSANEGTTTLVTDSDSVILKTKYSRDLSAAFTEIQNAIIALGGSF